MKSFLSGRTGTALAETPSSVEPQISAGLSMLAAANSIPPAAKAGASSVKCVREAGVIKKLIVTCECGKTVEIDCEYTTLTG